MLLWEIRKIIGNRWNLAFILCVVSLWGATLYLSGQAGSYQIYNRTLSFWHVLGSLSVGFFILFISTRIFISDKEDQVKEVILATRYGKGSLLLTRMLAVITCSSICIATLTIIQVFGFILFIPNETDMVSLPLHLSRALLFALIGGTLFSIFAACVCLLFNSQTATVIVCGFLFGMTYMLRSDLLQSYSLLWLLDKGFFSYLIRAKGVVMELEWPFLLSWYGCLLFLLISATIKIQARRHEL